MTGFSEIWWQLLILIVCSYFLGNLNIALIVSRARKKDITKQDSGNPGAMNMYRNFGFIVGVGILLFDMIKGAIPVIAGYFIFRNCSYSALDLAKGYCMSLGGVSGWASIAMFSAGLAEVLGHIYPVVQKFKGGKGVSSTIGVYVVAASIVNFWYVPLIVFTLGILYVYIFEWGSVGSLFITTSLPVFMIVWYAVFCDFSAGLMAIILLNAAFTVLSYWKHRTNLKKLAKGKENRTVLKTIFQRKRKKKNAEAAGESMENADSNG